MKINLELKNWVIDVLIGNWGLGVVIILVYGLVMNVFMLFYCIMELVVLFFFSFIVLLFLLLGFGYIVFFLDVICGIKLDFVCFFDGFKDYGWILGIMLLIIVYMFLWMLLFVILGIMKFYLYVMMFFILKDYLELQYDVVIEKSMVMMFGYKMKMFLLDLSFIGWVILCCFILGIGFLFLVFYVEVLYVVFYEDLKKELGEFVEVIFE